MINVWCILQFYYFKISVGICNGQRRYSSVYKYLKWYDIMRKIVMRSKTDGQLSFYIFTNNMASTRLYCVEWTKYSIRLKRSAICNRCFPGPTRVLNANGISIASELSAGFTRWQTDRPRYSVVHNRRHLFIRFGRIITWKQNKINIQLGLQ